MKPILNAPWHDQLLINLCLNLNLSFHMGIFSVLLSKFFLSFYVPKHWSAITAGCIFLLAQPELLPVDIFCRQVCTKWFTERFKIMIPWQLQKPWANLKYMTAGSKQMSFFCGWSPGGNTSFPIPCLRVYLSWLYTLHHWWRISLLSKTSQGLVRDTNTVLSLPS